MSRKGKVISMENNNLEVFSDAPVPKAVLKNVLPAMAAIATLIGNVFGAVYYIVYFLKKKSVLSIHPRDFKVRDKVCTGVLAIGIPASLGSLLMSVSQIILNSQMANYGNMAVAGMGVAMKVTMITGTICIGMGQGVQPLIGFCAGAKKWGRLKRIMNFSVRTVIRKTSAITGAVLQESKRRQTI